MNKKHELLSVQVNKKVKKEVRKGMKEAASMESTEETALIVAKKKTKPLAKEPADAPQHVKSEGSRWVNMLRRQSAENHVRMAKKQLKAH